MSISRKNNRANIGNRARKRRQKRMRRLKLISAAATVFAVVIIVFVLIGQKPSNSDLHATDLPASAQATLTTDQVTEDTEHVPYTGLEMNTALADNADVSASDVDMGVSSIDIAASENTPQSANATEENEVPAYTEDATPPDTELTYTTVLISATGDCTLGGDVATGGESRFQGYVDDYGYEYFMANVREIFENDDLTIINLEGTLTLSKDKRSGRQFNFRGEPANTQIMSSSSIEVATFANNHAKDYKEQGFEDTIKTVEDYEIGVSAYSKTYTTDVNGAAVTILAVTEWDYTTDELTQMVQQVRQESDLVIVSIHWGEESLYKPTSTQEKYGHALIDAGADLVIGNHSHVVGAIELYNEKYIVYSLGNFCFGGNGNPKDKDCMIFQQEFIVYSDGTVDDGGIGIIPCSVSSVSNKNNFQPTPKTGEDALKLLSKIGKYSTLDYDETLWLDSFTQAYASYQAG